MVAKSVHSRSLSLKVKVSIYFAVLVIETFVIFTHLNLYIKSHIRKGIFTFKITCLLLTVFFLKDFRPTVIIVLLQFVLETLIQ